MGIIGEMKRDKSIGSSSGSSGSRSSSSLLSSERPRPLSAFWGGLGKSSPKSEPVPKGYKLKHSYGGSTGHLDAYGMSGVGVGSGGGMRPAVSMPVVAAGVSPSSRSSSSNKNNSSNNNRHHRNSLPPLIQQQQQQQQQRQAPNQRSRAGVTSHHRMVNKIKQHVIV